MVVLGCSERILPFAQTFTDSRPLICSLSGGFIYKFRVEVTAFTNEIFRPLREVLCLSVVVLLHGDAVDAQVSLESSHLLTEDSLGTDVKLAPTRMLSFGVINLIIQRLNMILLPNLKLSLIFQSFLVQTGTFVVLPCLEFDKLLLYRSPASHQFLGAIDNRFERYSSLFLSRAPTVIRLLVLMMLMARTQRCTVEWMLVDYVVAGRWDSIVCYRPSWSIRAKKVNILGSLRRRIGLRLGLRHRSCFLPAHIGLNHNKK